MNKPQRHLNLEQLDDQSIAKKRNDILLCIKSCRKEALIGYNEQLEAVDAIISARSQLLISFDKLPVDDTQDNEWDEPPLFV